MWLNDDDVESTNAHWKNSEIMRSFVENYLNGKPVEEQVVIKNLSESVTKEAAFDEMGWSTNDEISIQDAADTHQVNLANEELDDMIKTLGNLAIESTKYGNEKATYMIERTIEEVRVLKNGEYNAI